MKEKILVSACLVGENCRYDGKNQKSSDILKLTKYYDLIPMCPEVSGGLKTPRRPSEIQGTKVVMDNRRDVTDNYHDGAYWASQIVRMYHIRLAILKEKSPSCGVHLIYDGTFSGKTIEGKGITTRKLESMGVKVINEDEARQLLSQLEANQTK